MGKRLIVQRRGKGSPVYRSKPWLHPAPAKYPPLTPVTLRGRVVELVHDPGRWVPLAHVVLENGEEFWIPAAEGMYVGQIIEVGPDAKPANGNILPVGRIPEGTQIYNVEIRPGDGGKLARSSGAYAVILGRSGNKTIVQLPSGKVKEIPNDARATIGIAAGAGRLEKPLLKAGAAYYKWKAKAHVWPRVRGVAMNAVNHPHGGGSHQSPSFPTTVSRDAPPGRKVGHIAARSTGRKKR
ncbi:50S ribosomal protein L2 [Pyrodictium abyssi]|uniref:Large ribosomal subunit protein uL2 n=1 Tax=Pyrodictium abyssi TaxID=54256 RepID=A0ABN6ZM11_9CREN|nr:50S ribosomal protein L2 [Pyrodictium abyssi]